MYSPTLPQPVPLEELGWANATYLGTGNSLWDPMMVWGTTVETDALDLFLAKQRRDTGLIMSPAHVLVRAVAQSLCEHPKLNRRVVWRRVFAFDGVNVLMPMLQTRSGEADTIFLHRADKMPLAEIARRFWSEVRDKALKAADDERRRREGSSLVRAWLSLRRKLRMRWVHRMAWLGFAVANRFRIPTVWDWQNELNGAHAFVNYLGFAGAPPLVAFKPSTLPMSSYSVSVTMGPSEPRAVVAENAVVIRRQASLFIRTDHRMVNAFEAAAFINTLRSYLSNPGALLEGESSTNQPKHTAKPMCSQQGVVSTAEIR